MQGFYEYFPIERVSYGRLFAETVAAELDRMGAGRAMVVASRSVSRGTDSIGRLRAALGGRLAGVFDEGAPHTPRAAVLAAAAMAREVRPDVLVSLGGGSAIDLAKMVQVARKGIVTPWKGRLW